jgi:5-(carboxyamino)imidazole ribonucleotide synthase
MVNFIGGIPTLEHVLNLDNAHLHLYDKAPRKGRKVGHATVRSDNAAEFESTLTALISIAQRVDLT